MKPHALFLLFQGNNTSTPVSSLAVQLNKSAFGISPVNPQISLSVPVANGRYVQYTD